MKYVTCEYSFDFESFKRSVKRQLVGMPCGYDRVLDCVFIALGSFVFNSSFHLTTAVVVPLNPCGLFSGPFKLDSYMFSSKINHTNILIVLNDNTLLLTYIRSNCNAFLLLSV